MRHFFTFILFLGFLACGNSSYSQANLLADLHLNNYSNSLNDLKPSLTIGNITYFYASHHHFGIELWRTDGTAAGTFMLKELSAGYVNNNASKELAELNGKVIFVGIDEDYGSELFITDGTKAGTQLLKDINPGALSSSPRHFYVWNGYLYFAAQTSDYGRELWRSNGTSAGTTLFKDLNPGTESSLPSGFTSFQNKLYFFATTATHGKEVWTSTGDYCMNGITRQKVIDLCRANDIPVFERNYSLVDTYGADEAFLTGTFGAQTPVSEIDGRQIGDGQLGPVTTRLRDLYKDLIERTCD